MGQIVGIAIVWFIIEMLLWYLLAQFMSGWWVFMWFIIAAVIGISFIRKGMAALNPMAQQMKAGGMMNPAMRPQESTMIKSVAVAAAGLLLLIPGVLSDLLALLVILPPVQKKLKDFANNYVMNNQQKMMEMMAKQMGGQNPFGGAGGMGGQNPFGGAGGMNNQNPFGQQQQNPFGNVFKQHTTVDGTAKNIPKDVKKITKSANDE
ncbi:MULTISPECIES: FxsA family protein [Psychrobacter]|uniref:FxsA family protein n=1 Tax=Psychrobacter communis TaxID=2762238 RepID=A0ABR8RLV6_9GAMM|nr:MULTISPECIES: FxsA family protein [Psychrobacter]MBD7948642.1 FxsA family protein [Psychrobacter communis]TSB22549.1 FxsA family protein [Psychrobacter sp. YGAH215]WLW67050.1 FxsA family protein [Psychrobacter sp. van23A]